MTSRAFDLLRAVVQRCQSCFGEAGADSASKEQSARTIVTDEQRTEYMRLPSGGV